jgi:hypothetical protein
MNEPIEPSGSLSEVIIATIISRIPLPEVEGPLEWEFRICDRERNVTGRKLEDEEIANTDDIAVFRNGYPVAVLHRDEEIDGFHIFAIGHAEKISSGYGVRDEAGNEVGDVELWERMDNAEVGAELVEFRNETTYIKGEDGLWASKENPENRFEPVDFTFGRHLES